MEEIMRPRILLIAVAAIMAISCTGQTGHIVEYLETDGVRLVRTTGSPKYDSPLFELSSDLVLGIDEGEPEWQMFSGPPRYLISTDGRLVLADSRRSEIFIVSSDGDLLSRLGGKGAGPGEFENLWGMHWAEDGKEFWIEDQRLQRVTRFSMEGEYLGSFNYAEQRRNWARRFLDLGNRRFLGVIMGLSRDNSPTRFAFIDSDLRWVKDFIEVPPQQMWEVGGGAWSAIPFIAVAGVTVFPDGKLLSYHPYQGRLTVYTTDGQPVLHIERDWDYPAVTAEDKERTLRRYRESPSEQRRELADRVPIPDKRAAFGAPRVDDAGRIWLTRSMPIYEGDEVVGYVYDIFGPDGVWLGTQEMSIRPIAIQGDYMYRTFSAESGAPRFERLKINWLIPEIEESVLK